MSLNAEYTFGSPGTEKGSIDQVAKRLFDVSVATTALILLGPLLLMLAFAVLCLEGRPIIYRHRRLTVERKAFDCLKFRSMVADAESKLQHHLSQNPVAASEWAESQKLSGDPRITRFGAFLRSSSLDELPQLINIIRGDMSLVGPRPIVADELTKYGDHADECLSVRPGLTGLWQVSGRSDCAYADRVRLDVDYVQNWSFSKDLVIFVKTFGVVLSRKGSA
ncbi:MAG: sugar transferase [Methylovirgula sp.]